jgi:serine/threonine protein phosphatase 1
MRKIVVSDIHGCHATFVELLKQFKLSTADQLFLLGDYIDRGPHSKQVFDTIFDLQTQGHQVHCLRGNHEELLLWAAEGTSQDMEIFLRNGGDTTLNSFGVRHPADIPEVYLDFMVGLPCWIESDEFIFVHAGLHFRHGDDPLTNREKMLWIRNWYADIDYRWLGSRRIVHGHTPTPGLKIAEMYRHFDDLQVLNIDAGCVYPHEGYGHLCGVDLTNREMIFVPREGGDEEES